MPEIDRNDGLLSEPVALWETLKAISGAKAGKATGLDGIPSEVLKCPRLHGFLHCLFSCVFERGTVPSQWLTAIINPIPKKRKDPRIPINNRG